MSTITLQQALNSGDITRIRIGGTAPGNEAADKDYVQTAVQAYDPAIGTLMLWRGVWAAGAYNKNDVVIHNGVTWIALQATSEEPGVGAGLTEWEVIAGDVASIKVYEYTKVTDILNIPDIGSGTGADGWTDIVTVSTDAAAVGRVYEFKMAINVAMSDAGDMSMLRFRADTGDGLPAWPTATILKREVTGTQDTFVVSYFFPEVATGTHLEMQIQAAKNVGGLQFHIFSADAIIEQKS